MRRKPLAISGGSYRSHSALKRLVRQFQIFSNAQPVATAATAAVRCQRPRRREAGPKSRTMCFSGIGCQPGRLQRTARSGRWWWQLTWWPLKGFLLQKRSAACQKARIEFLRFESRLCFDRRGLLAWRLTGPFYCADIMLTDFTAHSY